MKIAIVGCGYVGTVLAACLARIGHKVTGIDTDAGKIAMLRDRRAPFFEPGLDDLLKSLGEELIFTTLPIAEVAKIDQYDMWIVCVGTPTLPGGALDCRGVEDTVSEINEHVHRKVIAVKSTVMPGTCRSLQETYRDQTIIFWPEFLRQGTAVEDMQKELLSTTWVGDSERSYIEVGHGLHSMAFKCLPYEDVEMAKLALNGFLATRVNYVNALAHACQIAGADIANVQTLLARDLRVGTIFAGPGYGGSCLPKDFAALNTIYDFTHFSNHRHRKVWIQRIIEKARQRVLIYGMAFKEGTSDLRHSFAVELAQALIDSGIEPFLYDESVTAINAACDVIASPRIQETVKSETESISELAEGCDMLVVHNGRAPLTLREQMADNPTLVDLRNQYNTREVKEAGFTYMGLGRRV